MSENTVNKEEFGRDKIQKIYEQIVSLAPTCEEIEDFIEVSGKRDFISFTKKDNESLNVRLHTSEHIDVASCNFHMMLDTKIAPVFLDFLKEKRKKNQS